MADTIAKLIFEANTAQLKKAQDELNKLTKTAGKANKQIPKTRNSTEKLAEAFRNAGTATATLSGPLNGLSGRLSFISTGLNRIGVAGLATAASFTGLLFAVKNSLAVFQAFELQMFKLESLVKSTGGTAGFTAKELDGMAREMARNTMASASQLREAQGVLLTFKSISGEAFKSALGLTQDIGAVMGTTAVSGAKQLGKALEDPARNLTALTRAGISFTEAEANKIKMLQMSGQLQEAQSIVIQTLKDQVGGAGTGGGLAAATDLLADNFTELNIVIAEETGLADFAAASTKKLAEVFGALTNAIIETDEAELERLKNQKESRSIAGDAERKARIKELEEIIAKEAKRKEVVKKAAEDEKNRRAEADKEQFERTKTGFAIQLLQQEENLAKLQFNFDEADRIKLERIKKQAALELEVAQEKYGKLQVLQDIHDEKIKLAQQEINGKVSDIDKKSAQAKKAFDKKTRGDQNKQMIQDFSKRTAAVANMNKGLFRINQMAAIAETVVNTREAMQLARSTYPPPFGSIMAGVELVAGMANLKAIKSQTFGGGGSASGGGGGSSVPAATAATSAPVAPAMNDELIAQPTVVNVSVDNSIDPEGARRIVEAINEATMDGLEITAVVN